MVGSRAGWVSCCVVAVGAYVGGCGGESSGDSSDGAGGTSAIQTGGTGGHITGGSSGTGGSGGSAGRAVFTDGGTGNGGTGGSVTPGGRGGTGGTGGTISDGGSGGNLCTPMAVGRPPNASCPAAFACLDPKHPTTEQIDTNQSAEPNGAAGSGEGGSPGQAGAAGEPSGPSAGGASDGLDALELPLCSAASLDAELFLAFDLYQPIVTSGVNSVAIYKESESCTGTEIGEIWLSDFDMPAPETWTTQCARILGSELSTRLGLLVTDGGGMIRNARFVTSCQCERHLKRLTSCGWDALGSGGGSACE